MSDNLRPPEGKCRECGHPLERLPPQSGRKLRWGCTNIFCPTMTKSIVTIGGVHVTNKPSR